VTPNVRAKITAEACVAWPRKENSTPVPWSGEATHAVAGQLERVVRPHFIRLAMSLTFWVSFSICSAIGSTGWAEN
jgi:hypothetical protein